jgi:hypothetical protein
MPPRGSAVLASQRFNDPRWLRQGAQMRLIVLVMALRGFS